MNAVNLYKVCSEWNDWGEYVYVESFCEAIKKWLKHVNSQEYRTEEDDWFTRSKIHVFFDPIHKKFVAMQYYAVAGRGTVVLDGPKYDVTRDTMDIVKQHDPFKIAEAHEGEATPP